MAVPHITAAITTIFANLLTAYTSFYITRLHSSLSFSCHVISTGKILCLSCAIFPICVLSPAGGFRPPHCEFFLEQRCSVYCNRPVKRLEKPIPGNHILTNGRLSSSNKTILKLHTLSKYIKTPDVVSTPHPTQSYIIINTSDFNL
jgi:hypothetical protein